MTTENKDDTVAVTVTIAKDSPRFDGHFAGDPLLPAVAQLSDIILPAVREHFDSGSLASLNRVKFTRPIRPGDEVTLTLSKKEDAIRFQMSVENEKACSGTLRMATSGSTQQGATA